MSSSQHWWVYIIQAESGRLYTGITTDLERRFQQHASGKGAKFFRGDSPSEMVFTEACENRSVASRREADIKSLNREQKLALIAAGSEV